LSQGHPSVPAAFPNAGARSGCPGWPKATAPFGAARSVLDSREHDGILAASGPPVPPNPQFVAVYSRNLSTANIMCRVLEDALLTRVSVSPRKVVEHEQAVSNGVRE